MDQRTDSAGVLLPPIVLFAGTLALSFVLHWLKPVPVLRPAVARLLGVAVFVASFWLARSAETAFRRAGTNIRPDQPSMALLTDGPFRFSRKPLYLATTGMYLAAALFFNAFWPLVLLIPMLCPPRGGHSARGAVPGGQVRRALPDYRRRVRRWL